MEINTQLKRERIAVDIDNYGDGRGDLVVVLYVPDKSQPEHEHIKLDKNSAIQLRNYLNEYIDGKLSTGN